MDGVVFDIQHYAIYDGPGIRTTVFLKGCPLRCAWCHNPESQAARPQMGYRLDRCAGCGSCVQACSAGALALDGERVRRDARRCTLCGTCVAVCPRGAREVIGRAMTADMVVDAVCGDRPFYDASGGGVTISGGEPTAQADFLLALLAALKRHGIHTALETCGFFREELIEPLCALVDLFLFDIKDIEDARHQRWTGVSATRILTNFSALVGRVSSNRMIARIPLIPGLNADTESCERLVAFLRHAGYEGPIHVMPYNRLARTKYEQLGRAGDYRDMGALDDAVIGAFAHTAGRRGFEVVVNE